MAIKSTGHVITVSESSARDLREIFEISEDQLSVIPHGIVPPVERCPDTFATSAIPEDRPFALYLGNIEPRKNLIPLITAFESERVKSTGCRLVIAGKPAWDFIDTMRAIESAPNTEYAGFVSDRERDSLMSRCALFVFPSLYEGFGFPVLEALAAGAPVICSDRGSLAEVAGPARRFRDLDEETIADAVTEALSDDEWRRSIRIAGPDWARRFSWEASVERHVEVYRSVLSSAI